jgi:signal transduction histidine kinase
VDYPTLDVCDLYYQANGKFYTQKLSSNNPFSARTYKHQNFLFDIKLPKDSVRTYYLRVRSSEQMVLPLVVGTPQKMAEAMLTPDILWGILIGLLVVMILYNFFVFISTGDKSYLYYVLYTTFIGLTQTTLSGYTYRYLFPNSPELFNKGIVVFPGIAGISAVFFITSFLHTKDRTPRLHKVFPVIIVLYALAIVLRLAGFDHESYRMIDISALSITVMTYAAAITISMQGYRPARIFLVAWTMFFIGVVLFVLRNLGVLPYNDFTNYTMQAGTAFEVTLLSLALADRINIFKEEKEKYQEEALAALKENERIVREQNVLLEAKVNERTQKLSDANAELNQALIDLKEAEGQLVEAEKMASLGQLTAGIAHEINNPINFVTSNINPLKRDIDILLDAITTIEGVGLSEDHADEKQKKIEEYKEEIDLDYLKMEIGHLLKGINEGASRTAEIVKGLRVFSRLDEDDLKRADINEGLDSTLIIVNNLLDNKIRIEKNYGDIPLIECYPGKLNQVFLNIISNAIHAIKQRHQDVPGGEIKISTSSDDDNVFISIADNGTGMDETTKRKVFEPFFTTKDVGEGTGLGMSIVYNTIKRHEGEIEINSTVGVGTEFIIKLPVFLAILQN